jgi:hypothetical protein
MRVVSVSFLAVLFIFSCDDNKVATKDECVDYAEKLVTCTKEYETDAIDSAESSEIVDLCRQDMESTDDQCSLACDRSQDCTIWFGCVQACAQ